MYVYIYIYINISESLFKKNNYRYSRVLYTTFPPLKKNLGAIPLSDPTQI